MAKWDKRVLYIVPSPSLPFHPCTFAQFLIMQLVPGTEEKRAYKYISRQGGETVSEVQKTQYRNTSQHVTRELFLQTLKRSPSALYVMTSFDPAIRFKFPFSRPLLSRLQSSSGYMMSWKLTAYIRPTQETKRFFLKHAHGWCADYVYVQDWRM